MFDFTPWLLGIESELLTFMTSTGGVLIGTARAAVASLALATIIILFLRAHSEANQPPLGGVFSLLWKFGLCLMILGAWNVPAPGLGSPIGTWIPNQGLNLARLIGWEGAQDCMKHIASWSGIEAPSSVFSIAAVYWLMTLGLLLFAALVLAVILIGPLMMVAVLVVVGPIFVPMWPVPELNGYARGYLRCLITYSLVPVVAAATLRVCANIVIPSSSAVLSLSAEDALPKAFMLCVGLAVGLVAMVFCIKISNHIMSGSAGHGSGWFVAGISALRRLL